MPQFVYACQNCKFEVKHILEKSFGAVYGYACPECKKCNKFDFVREVNIAKEIFERGLRIRNQRRRPGDKLYKTEVRPRPPEKEKK
jgi:hypothetical protein